MYLLERQRKILGLLLANEQRMTGSQIAQMIGITDRTVRNDIKDLNEGINESPASYVESIRGKGYLDLLRVFVHIRNIPGRAL